MVAPVLGRPQGWCYAPPPSAAGGLDPVRSPVCWLCKRSVENRARRERTRSTRCIAAGIPCLAAGNHDVKNDDQLAHAGDERDLLFLSLGQQALVEGFEHGIVPRRSPKTRHVEEIADSAPSPLDVAFAAPLAAVVI